MSDNVAAIILASIGVLAGFGLALISWLSRRREDRLRADFAAREMFLQQIATSGQELLQRQLEREREMAAAERKELYSRIQAYDPNAGDFLPAQPSIVPLPSRPEADTLDPRSFTEEELGKMGLVAQADGMIRDTRNDELFEEVSDWRFWQADLKKRNLPENVSPTIVREHGWERAVAVAKAQTAAKKAAGAAKN